MQEIPVLVPCLMVHYSQWFQISLVWIELSQSKTDWIIVDIPRNVLILGWARFKLITVINYLVPPDVERSEGDVVGAREVEYLVVAGEGLEEVVGELEDGVGDDVVDDVLLVRVRVGVGHAHRVWGKREELGATEISKKAFAKLQLGRARKRINAT